MLARSRDILGFCRWRQLLNAPPDLMNCLTEGEAVAAIRRSSLKPNGGVAPGADVTPCQSRRYSSDCQTEVCCGCNLSFKRNGGRAISGRQGDAPSESMLFVGLPHGDVLWLQFVAQT